jgi:hypothetical protein
MFFVLSSLLLKASATERLGFGLVIGFLKMVGATVSNLAGIDSAGGCPLYDLI